MQKPMFTTAAAAIAMTAVTASPAQARFMQTDPIGYEDGMNLYAYVGNDPVNGWDPSGMQGCVDAATNSPTGGNQSLLTGLCVDAAGFDPETQGIQTEVSTPEIDQSARINMPSIANDAGPGENIAQFDQEGSDVSFTPLSATSSQGENTVQGRAGPVGDPDAVGHSQPDLSDARATYSNIAPGYQNRNAGDHLQVNAGRPNYIINRGIVIVIEKSQGQFRARVISGNPTDRQIREIRSQLTRMQRGQ